MAEKGKQQGGEKRGEGAGGGGGGGGGRGEMLNCQRTL